MIQRNLYMASRACLASFTFCYCRALMIEIVIPLPWYSRLANRAYTCYPRICHVGDASGSMIPMMVDYVITLFISGTSRNDSRARDTIL